MGLIFTSGMFWDYDASLVTDACALVANTARGSMILRQTKNTSRLAAVQIAGVLYESGLSEIGWSCFKFWL